MPPSQSWRIQKLIPLARKWQPRLPRPTFGRRSALWIGCLGVISAVILLAWQASIMATEQHERDSAAMIEGNFAMPELIVVPEPDPAAYGQLLLDRAAARGRLVPLGD